MRTPLFVFALRVSNLTMPSSDRTPALEGLLFELLLWLLLHYMTQGNDGWLQDQGLGRALVWRKFKKTGTIHLGGTESERTQWRYCRMHSLEIAVGELLFTLSQNIGMQEHKGKKKLNEKISNYLLMFCIKYISGFTDKIHCEEQSIISFLNEWG